MYYPVDQLEELRKQLEKERNLSFEEANKELKNVKLEVESKRHGLEARQNDLEGVLAEVLVSCLDFRKQCILIELAPYQNHLFH